MTKKVFDTSKRKWVTLSRPPTVREKECANCKAKTRHPVDFCWRCV